MNEDPLRRRAVIGPDGSRVGSASHAQSALRHFVITTNRNRRRKNLPPVQTRHFHVEEVKLDTGGTVFWVTKPEPSA